MGFKAGTQVTIDNALKMMMVKSANDMAVVLAEGVGGSVDGFSAMMNATAQKLGMTQTHYVNPNGLPADEQVTSARDLAILARAIIRDLPEYEYFVHIPAIKFGRRITPNFNKLIGRYPGADGMKTGFICASGYNLVATATRGNKRLIAVVLGASSGQARAVKAAQLLERGFNTGGGLTWLQPALGSVDALAPIDAAPPNLRDEMCGPKRKRPASDADDEVVASSNEASSQAMSFFTAGLQPPTLRPVDMIAAAAAPVEPVIVYTGPKKVGADLIAANAVEEARQTPKPKGKKGTKTAAKKPDAATDTKDAKPAVSADAKPAAKSETKPAAKPAASKQAAVKPDAAAPKPAAAKPAATKPAAAKPATAGTTAPATTPAKPKAAAKPAPKATTGEAKPAAAAPRT
jgi:D-alanyl-D-alanine carboxypeptidase